MVQTNSKNGSANSGSKSATHEFLTREDVDFNLLAPALCAAGEAVYSWDIASDAIVWSPNAPEVLGTAAHNVPYTGAVLAERVSKDEKSAVGELLNWRGSSQHKGAFHLEFNFTPRLGEPRRWIEDRGQCLFNKDGEPMRVVGALRDITTRKEVEALLVRLTTYDDATGVLHRANFVRNLKNAS